MALAVITGAGAPGGIGMACARALGAAGFDLAIAATTGYEGAAGTISFGGRADPGRQIAISEVRPGGPVTVELTGP